MSIPAASSSVLLGCAQRIGLSNHPGSAASCAEALNAELAAAATVPRRTSRLVTINLPAVRFYDFSCALVAPRRVRKRAASSRLALGRRQLFQANHGHVPILNRNRQRVEIGRASCRE